jgi:hypothetical protein
VPLSTSTLNALQKVGAAAFTAEERLKKDVQEYAERVHAAIAKNPYSLGNDTLIENWKVAARLAHTLMGIEKELNEVYQLASQLIDDDQPTLSEVPALAASTRSAGKEVAQKAVSVKVKMKKKSIKLANKTEVVQTDLAATGVLAKPRKNAATKKTKSAGTSEKTAARGSNPAKLFSYFERTLSPSEFSVVSQTAVAKETGIPLGSMTAAIKKLIESGRVTAAPNGSLKLVPSQPSVQA